VPVVTNGKGRVSPAPVILLVALIPFSCGCADTRSYLLRTCREVRRYGLMPRLEYPHPDSLAKEDLLMDLCEELDEAQTADAIPALLYLYACRITDGVTGKALGWAIGSAARRHPCCFGDYLSVMSEEMQLGVLGELAWDMSIELPSTAQFSTGAAVAKYMLAAVTQTTREGFHEWPRDLARRFLLHFLTVAPSARSSPMSATRTGGGKGDILLFLGQPGPPTSTHAEVCTHPMG